MLDNQAKVIVVGAGPVGLTITNMLAQAGHSVILFERYPSFYNLPRAGHMDDDVLRIMQGVGCLDDVLDDFFTVAKVDMFGADGEVLFEITHTHESPSSFHGGFVFQPSLERALCRQLARHEDLVKLYQGWVVESARQSESSVRVRARPTPSADESEDGPAGVFHCDYLIAADGAGSTIRKGLKIVRDDYGFNERWLDVDVAYRRSCDFGRPAVIGDPKRPMCHAPLGKRHHRFLWQLLAGESSIEFTTPRKAWELLAGKGATPDNVEIVRQAIYTFEYRLAQRWRSGRIFLVGDAAHTMPPSLGQGLCSGLRDAENLGWKLDLVLRALCKDSILDSYEIERCPHVKAWAALSLKAGEILCLTDPQKAAARDAHFRATGAPAWRPPPVLNSGLLDWPGERAGVAGELFIQRKIRVGERVGLFDDVIGSGFLLVARSDPRRYLSAEDEEFARRIGMRCAWLSREAHGGLAFADDRGEYADFFANAGQAAVIVRPDRYIFGGARQFADLSGLIKRLEQTLQGGTHVLPRS